jgi:hypothetical protein
LIAASRNFERMQDYIVGRLSDDERRAFEDRLVREPALARELEESLRLREGLQQLRTQGYFAGTASRRRSVRSWLPALAAAALAGLALFVSWQRETGPSPVLTGSLESRSDVAPLVSAHFTFVSVRGDSTPDLHLPSAGAIEIRAEPATRLPGSHYRVTLMRRDAAGSARPVGVLPALTASPDGYVHCFVDASRVKAGRYLLRIERDGAEADTAEFPFNLTVLGNRPSQ